MTSRIAHAVTASWWVARLAPEARRPPHPASRFAVDPPPLPGPFPVRGSTAAARLVALLPLATSGLLWAALLLGIR